MDAIEFSVTLNLSLALKGNRVNLSIRDVELKPAIVSLPIEFDPRLQDRSKRKREGKTIFDVILETARGYVAKTGVNEFSAADLYGQAKEIYPDLKRNSFNSHVIAAASNHPSYKHYPNVRDYFIYLKDGKYKLKDEYLGDLRHRLKPVKELAELPSKIRPSDQVREYAKKHFISPARARNESRVSIRVGDVHKALGLKDRVTLVYSALKSKKFQKLCDISLVEPVEQRISTTTRFTYNL